MRHKKLLTLGITLSLVLILAGCGNNNEKTSKSDDKKVSKVEKKKSHKKQGGKKTKKSDKKKDTVVKPKTVASTQTQTAQQPAQNNNASNSQQAAATPRPAAPATSKVLGVPFISQGSTMLCEGGSLLEALHYKGVTSQGLMSFVNSMPKSPNNNPYNGYAGEWSHNVDGTYQGMMAGPVTQWAANVGGHATQISGPAAIKASINNNNPVVAWIVYGFSSPEFKQMPWGRAVWNGHVICVDGYRPGGYHVVDPNAGSYWVSSSAFEGSNGVTGMAVSVG